LPQNSSISWESHLYGFFTGFIAAFIFGKSRVKSPDEKENSDNDDDFNSFDNSYLDGVDIEYHFNEKQDK
jgi:hypothetical protein